MKQINGMIVSGFVLAILFAVCPGAKADRQPSRSLDEMEDVSSLIIDGTVISVTDVGKKELKHPEGKSVFKIRRQALFEIQKVQKGQLDSKSGSVLLEYWKVDDARFKGEVAPDLKVNDRFRLYAEAVTIDEHDGSTTIFIHTPNAVRPEALKVKEVDPSTDTQEKRHPSFLPGMPQSANSPPPPDAQSSRVEQPSDTPLSSTRWLVVAVVVVVVAALGLHWLFLKRRK